MTRAILKQGIGDAGAQHDKSHGTDTVRDVLVSLASAGSLVSGFIATPVTGVLQKSVIESASYLYSVSINLEDAGSAGTTTVVAKVNGTIRATAAIVNTLPDDTTITDTLDPPFALAAGDVVTLEVSTIGTDMDELAASLRISPLLVE